MEYTTYRLPRPSREEMSAQCSCRFPVNYQDPRCTTPICRYSRCGGVYVRLFGQEYYRVP
mgnify:CR=1 FL=1